MRTAERPRLHYFRNAAGVTAVALPFALDTLVKDWTRVQRAMVRERPAEFRRDEWAYLMSSLTRERLRAPFTEAFGEAMATLPKGAAVGALARPRGTIAVWLPASVSLLGPLVSAMLLMTGSRLRLKGSARATDLTSTFLDFVRGKAPRGSALARALRQNVAHEVFDRDDTRNAAWAAAADMRVLFGSEEAARGVERLPHPTGSIASYFVDRRSEAWLHPDELTDANLRDVIRAFAIRGQAACTSPSRLVLIGAKDRDAVAVRDRMVALWSSAAPGDPAPHAASANVLASQWARANGWRAALAPRNAAVLAAGRYDLPFKPAALMLPVVAAREAQALAGLPANAQTLGVASNPRRLRRWLEIAASSKALRIVPIREMHRFGSIWDGRRFWADAFQIVEVRA